MNLNPQELTEEQWMQFQHKPVFIRIMPAHGNSFEIPVFIKRVFKNAVQVTAIEIFYNAQFKPYFASAGFDSDTIISTQDIAHLREHS